MLSRSCCVILWTWCGVAFLAATEPAAPAKAVKPATEWKSMFDGKTLTGWKVPNFGTQGEVVVKDQAILLNFGDGITGITWDKEFPTAGYEIEVTAQRLDGNDFFCGLTFPVEKKSLTFICGGWGGTVVGISSLDGQDAANNETAQFMEFKDKQWYKIRVRVILERIVTWIDDKEINSVDLRDRELSVRNEVELSKPVGLTTWKTTASVKDVRYRLLSDEEKKALFPKEKK